ncbi:T9SS type A sorting domain-containing protein [Sphingobacteriales bacterium CHB3]|nr:T9SS type A sorting domain-containing protein [Sphingobacteriales bacterium CHB3]
MFPIIPTKGANKRRKRMKKLYGGYAALLTILIVLPQAGLSQWVQANGPYGGWVTAVGVNPNTATLFVGTLGAGNFRSTNNGASWTASNEGLSFGGSYFGGVAFAAKGANMFAGTAAGIYVTTNNGTSWTSTTATGALSLLVNGNDIFAGTSSGAFRSTNDGASWNPINTGLTTSRVNALAAIGSSVFAGTQGGGVFISTNSGANWSPVISGLTNLTVNSLAVNGTTLFAGTLSGVFRSTNNGGNWTSVSANLTTALLVSGGSIYAGGSGISVSTNNGDSWAPAGTGLTFSLVSCLAASGSTLLAGGGSYFAGLNISTNGGVSWSESNTGIAATHVRAVTARPNGTGGFDLFAGTNENGIHRSTDGGNTWVSFRTGFNAAVVNALAHNGSTIFSGSFLGVQTSTDNGVSWTTMNAGLPGNASTNAFTVLGSNVFAGTASGVYLTTNNGANWTQRNSGITSTGINTVTALGQNLYAAGNGVFFSTNEGVSWTPIGSGVTSTNTRAIAFIGTDIFAGTQNGIFRSTNNGASWTSANTGLNSTNIYSLAAFGTNLIAGAGFGLYISTNSGGNWTAINTGLPENLGIIFPIIYNITVVPFATGTTIFAGTASMGLWRRQASQVTSVQTATSGRPEQFNLMQNYPNPFNPTTTIEFQIAEGGFVSLKIFDVLGREVSILVNEHLKPGTYKTEFNADGLAGGMYFYRLESGGFTRTRKLILQK